MNVLVIGLGSIGLRHLNNLVHLKIKKISVVRRNKKAHENFNIYDSIESAFKNEIFSHVIISNPSSLHFKAFKKVIINNVSKIYLEKPIATNLKDGLEILNLSKKYPNTSVIVGYDLRFDPGLNKIKNIIDSKVLGSLISFQSEVGQYLPDWRPHQDYRNGMSAVKKLGGGVMLDLIHEYDYINWLLGPIIKIVGFHDKISSLEIETEDISKVIMQTKCGAIGTISLDYIQKKLVRNCKLVFSNGIITWDNTKSKVSWKLNSKKSYNHYEYKNFTRNSRFLSAMKNFLDLDKKSFINSSTLIDGIKSLELVNNAKKSCENNTIIYL